MRLLSYEACEIHQLVSTMLDVENVSSMSWFINELFQIVSVSSDLGYGHGLGHGHGAVLESGYGLGHGVGHGAVIVDGGYGHGLGHGSLLGHGAVLESG